MALHAGIDIAIVGTSVAGAALAARLARDGFSVLLLQPSDSTAAADAWLPPWGVREARRVGLLADLQAAAPQVITRLAGLHPLDLSALVPDVPGAMEFTPPRLLATLLDAAQDAGATLLHGVDAITVAAGVPPTLGFRHQDEPRRLRPGLVVGAEGTLVARQIGARRYREPQHHVVAETLIDAAGPWPADTQALVIDDGACVQAFPHGVGQRRLVLCHPADAARRFASESACRRMLATCRPPGLSRAAAMAGAQPRGGWTAVSNAAVWSDTVAAAGVVLIGEAAGRSDPSTGQHLANSLRDVRLVAETIGRARFWDDGIFAAYAAERRQRLRRLRLHGAVFAALFCEFNGAAAWWRAGWAAHELHDRAAGLPMLVPLLGPFGLPEAAFDVAAQWLRLDATHGRGAAREAPASDRPDPSRAGLRRPTGGSSGGAFECGEIIEL